MNDDIFSNERAMSLDWATLLTRVREAWSQSPLIPEPEPSVILPPGMPGDLVVLLVQRWRRNAYWIEWCENVGGRWEYHGERVNRRQRHRLRARARLTPYVPPAEDKTDE